VIKVFVLWVERMVYLEVLRACDVEGAADFNLAVESCCATGNRAITSRGYDPDAANAVDAEAASCNDTNAAKAVATEPVAAGRLQASAAAVAGAAVGAAAPRASTPSPPSLPSLKPPWQRRQHRLWRCH
jgi:hypothetical protein